MLYRKPKIGEYIRNTANGSVSKIMMENSSEAAWVLRENYDHVKVEVDESIKPPVEVTKYINLYPNGFTSSFLTRKEADEYAAKERIARVKVKLTEGVFDE